LLNAAPQITLLRSDVGDAPTHERPITANPNAAPIGTADARIEGVDAIRMFAAIGAAWLHTAQSDELAHTGEYGRFAVPVFNTIAAYFLVRSIRRKPDRHYLPYLRVRLAKLYLPFLAWGAIYLFARWAKSTVTGSPLKPVRPGVLLEGPSHQLWYLPFVLICCAIGFPVARWALEARWRQWAVALACGIVCLVMGLSKIPDFHEPLSKVGLDYFWNRVWYRTPSFLSGFAMAMVVGHRSSAWDVVAVDRGHKRQIVGAACFIAATCFVIAGVNFPNIDLGGGTIIEIRSTWYTCSGLFFVASAFGGWENRGTRFLSELRYYAFGVFLAHTLFIEGAQAAFERYAPEIAKTWPLDIGIYIFAITGSIALTAIIHASKWFRWMIPS